MSLAAAILDAALFALSFALTHSPTLSVRCFYHFIVTLCSPRLRRLRPRARKAVASFLASADDQAAIVVLEWQDHLRQWPEHPRGVRNAVLNALVALGGILCPEAPDIAVYFPTTAAYLDAKSMLRDDHWDFCGVSEARAAKWGLQARPAVARTVSVFKAEGQADIVREDVQFFEG